MNEYQFNIEHIGKGIDFFLLQRWLTWMNQKKRKNWFVCSLFQFVIRYRWHTIYKSMDGFNDDDDDQKQQQQQQQSRRRRWYIWWKKIDVMIENEKKNNKQETFPNQFDNDDKIQMIFFFVCRTNIFSQWWLQVNDNGSFLFAT